MIKNDGMGDLVLASGLIAALGKHFRGEVDLVTCAANREVAEGIEHLRNRFYVSRDSLHFSGRAWSLGLLWPRISQEDRPVVDAITSRQYDVAICLRRFIRQSSLVLMQRTRAKQKFSLWQFPSNSTPAMALKASKGWLHCVGHENLISELCYAQGCVEDVLKTTLNAEPKLTFCTRQSTMPGGRRLAIGISGSSANWPAGHWIDLAMIMAAGGWKIVLLGGPDNIELGQIILRKVPGAESVVGRASLKETAELLRSCDAYIGNDTGLSHVAGLVVLKCLVILGGGTFRRFFPWPTRHSQTVVYHGLECFDCDWSCKFSERYCLSLVRPRDVQAAFEEMMRANGGSAEIDLNPLSDVYRPGWRRSEGAQPRQFHLPV